MSKHTPGPWSVVDGYYPGFIGIQGPSFEVSVVVSAPDIDIKDYMARTADARLIAAAPDLLEALIAVVRVADRATDEFDLARAAIAKARGAA